MADQSQEVPINSEVPQKRPLKILHIEDSPVIRQIIKEELGRFPKDVSEIVPFSSVEEAREYLNTPGVEPPDAIVSDLVLGVGKENPIKFASEMAKKEKWRKIPFVILSATPSLLRHAPKIDEGLITDVLEKDSGRPLDLVEALRYIKDNMTPGVGEITLMHFKKRKKA